MFGLGATELFFAVAVSLGLMFLGGVIALVFISKRRAKRTIRKEP